MKIIQIEVTNACFHSCANCTRFCGHHKKPFLMDYETFQKAVDSMEGFSGMVGIMGGEPTLHPQFERLVKYYRSRIEPSKIYKTSTEPIQNFNRYLIENDMQNIKQKRGLWSSLGQGYYKHFELIQETFPFQLINDHSHSGLHQSLLISRKELGIPDKKWIQMRDNCWAQNQWSASITPKGAFFCEVAAALDMLFDGPGGWPIEKGWWKRKPEDFKDQLHWCEFCSATLNVPRMEAASGIDIISPMMYEKLKKIDSPKLKKGNFKIFKPEDYSETNLECDYSSEWYLPDGDNTKRASCSNMSLYPKKLEAVIILSDNKIPDSVKHFDKTVILDKSGQLSSSDYLTAIDIDEAVKMLDFDDWVIFIEAETRLNPDFRKIFFSWIFNPGCLYCFSENIEEPDEGLAFFPGGKSYLPHPFILANRNALSMRGENGMRAPTDFLFSWPKEKIVLLNSLKNEDSGKVLADLREKERRKTISMTEHILSFWEDFQRKHNNETALYGAGNHTKWLLGKLQERHLPMPAMIFDDDPDDLELAGVPVIKSDKRKDFNINAVLVSSDTYSVEMTKRASLIWRGTGVKVVNPYSEFTDPQFQK